MLPNHSQAQLCLQRGLFNGLSRFAQWEERMLGLSEQEQQLSFAVFVEALLAIRTLPQATDIWPEGVVPAEARRRYGLPERIPGADGLLRTLTGDVHPYQLLYRPGRPALTRKELTPFLELADRVSQPLLVSNCNTLPATVRNRSDFHAILGSDLDRLDSREFMMMRRWLQGIGLFPERHPLPVPLARLFGEVNTALQQEDRLLALTATGLDVPLLALKWVESQGRGAVVLVVASTLSALRELLLYWRRLVTWSDLSAVWLAGEVANGVDVSQLKQADWDLPLLQESEGIRRFLNGRFTGVRVILSTLSGVRLLARAMIGGAPIDLGIFLDARDLAGDPFALQDNHLPLRKRLLLTPAFRQSIPGSADAEGGNKRILHLL
ncbi:hypothetical protein, partial [Candidatus Magnetaquicoccus inordinatus]|uniref:hypothetical protein n=1 Tax=Candidatus Magnetaquicoccus inordinatus TaxID=2496818 RepID=UPI00102B49B4